MDYFRTLAVVLAVMVCASARADRSLNDLSGPWRLFVDDHAVAEKSGIVRTYHPFVKHAGNPVLVGDKPWEAGIVYLYGTVLPNETGTGYRMWYACLPKIDNYDGSHTLYATSTDGITWTKPNLGIRTWNGSANNNMFFNRTTGSGISSTMHTPWDPDPSRTYRFMNYEGGGFWGACSADGVQTVDLPGNPVFTGGSDVGQFMWDPFLERYRGYVKNSWYDWNGLRRRAVALTETTDIASWPTEELILVPDRHDDRWSSNPVYRTHFYGLSAFAYESMYIGFLWIFRATDAEGYYVGPVYTEIVTSHDGVHWEREEGDRPPMVPLGPNGAWDDGQLYTATQPILVGDTLRLYYGACNQPHGTGLNITTCSIGLATLRKDGFASLDAGSTPGVLTTHILTHAAGNLRVNATASGGSVRAEVLDADRNVIPGYSADACLPLTGDGIDQPVAWSTKTQLPDEPAGIRLRFILQNASLYSFRADGPLDVLEGPKFSLHPQPVTTCPGGTATFTVEATGTGELTYAWHRDGALLASGARHSGVDTPSLTISPVYESDAGRYACVVRDSLTSSTSNEAALATVTVSFTGIGSLGTGGSTVSGVASDGSVVCGTSAGQPVIWTAGGGLVGLGLPGGATSATAVGVGIGPGGSVVLAADTNAATSRARRWDGNTAGLGTWSDLPRLRGTTEWQPLALGTDGNSDVWIAGSSPNGGDGNGREAAYYRQSSGTTVAPPLPSGGHDHSDLHAVADNGYAAGQYQYLGVAPTGGARNAMKCTGPTSSSPLNTLLGAPSSKNEAICRAISRNGAVAGGWSFYTNQVALGQPCLWTSQTGVVPLPFIPGGDGDNDGAVLAISGDGTLAGGYTFYNGPVDGPREAFIWDAVSGTRRLQDVLSTAYALDLTGWNLQEVRAISADGRTIAGIGLHDARPEGWVARIGSVAQPPSIEQQPVKQLVTPGGTATFAVTASAPAPLSYVWQKDGLDLAESSRIIGVRGPVLVILGVTTDDAGVYRCVVSVPCGVSTSQEASLLPLLPPDQDRDGDVDADDVPLFQQCATGAAVSVEPHCAPSDFDGDGDVDLDDYGMLQRCYNGPGRTPAPACLVD